MTIEANDTTGFFLFSLDTELAWGYFDLDSLRPQKYSSDGSRERRAIIRLLDILDEFNLAATWALVGHLFYEKCEKCDICPILGWKGRYHSFEEIYETQAPLWYGTDILKTLLARGSKHEIAFHGYTHQVFDEHKMSPSEAITEIQEWLRVASRNNIKPYTVIFPRNRIGYLEAFREAGFGCYRGDELLPRDYAIPLIGKMLNRIDLVLQFRTPQVYDAKVAPSGLVNLPASRWLFRMDRRVERVLDSLNLSNLPLQRLIKGVDKAVKEKKIIHFWAHPCEFQIEKDWAKLRYLFNYVADLVVLGKLRSVTMADLAREVSVRERGP